MRRPPGLQASPGGHSLPQQIALWLPLALALAVATMARRVWQTIELQPLAQAAAPLPAPPSVDAAQPLPNSVLSPVFTPEVQRWSPHIQAWASTYSLPPDLIATVMQIESCGDPAALSSAGASGLFQVMPFHFASGEDGYIPEVNARRGLAYLARSLALAQGRVDLALAGYNGGLRRVTQPMDSWPDETRRYVLWGTGLYAEAISGGSSSPTLQRWLEAGGSRLCRKAAQHPSPPL